MKIFKFKLIIALSMLLGTFAVLNDLAGAQAKGTVVVIEVDGAINPATDDFLKSSLAKAEQQDAKLFVLVLNTPGGLLTSMQTMVESLLEAKVPTVVYVSPSGGGAISAGVFITLAGHYAVMAPGTTIGAAHPVLSSGGDVKGDMGAKVENFAVSLVKAIAEQRGRNVKWAEQAVRDSVAITDREAEQEGVIDFVATDIDRILEKLEGRTVDVQGSPVTLSNLKTAPRQNIAMNLKQTIVNILADPNIAILLGLGALLGIGIELYHPGGIVPGVFGVICLVLSLIAGQVLPISLGGVALLVLAAMFFGVEVFIPSFGIWGVAGIICLVLGSIYFIDTDQVWSGPEFAVDKPLIGSIAAFVGLLLLAVCYLAVKSAKRSVTTGREGLLGKTARIHSEFQSKDGFATGKVLVMGEIWDAQYRVSEGGELPELGQKVIVKSIEDGMLLEIDFK